MPFPRDGGSFGSNNFWNGQVWKWWNGEPPFDEIGPLAMNPNGISVTNQVIETNGVSVTNEVVVSNPHWVIRRWRSEVNGTILVDWSIAKPLFNDSAGVTARQWK